MKKISKGDIIDVVAPASACNPQELELALNWLRDQGYEPRVPADMLEPDMYLANTDKKRFSQLKAALSNKTSKVVWCVRGGYSALRLVPDLMKMKKPAPKILIGMSDITILHQFLNQKWNWPSLHAPILARSHEMRDQRPEDYAELFGLLEGSAEYIEFTNLEAINPAAVKNKKKIKGKMTGGNLFSFCSMLGTKLQPKVNNHFIFFEDTGERGYKIDRILQQLDQAGIFKKCKGVFWGEVIKAEEADGKNYAWPTIEAFFKKHPFPVYRGIESGHAEKQRPIYFNTQAELTSNSLRVYAP